MVSAAEKTVTGGTLAGAATTGATGPISFPQRVQKAPSAVCRPHIGQVTIGLYLMIGPVDCVGCFAASIAGSSIFERFLSSRSAA